MRKVIDVKELEEVFIFFFCSVLFLSYYFCKIVN